MIKVVFKNECDIQEIELDLGGPVLTMIEIAPMDWHSEDDSYTDEFGIVERNHPVVDDIMVTKVNGESVPVLIEMADRLLTKMKKLGEIEYLIERINS